MSYYGDGPSDLPQNALIQRAISRSSRGQGGYATQQRLNLPAGVTVQQLLRNNAKHLAAFPGDAASHPDLYGALVKHALEGRQLAAQVRTVRKVKAPPTYGG